MRSDPRPRIRQIISEFERAGRPLSVGTIRTAMKGGSPNIIAEELRLFRGTPEPRRQAASQPETPPPNVDETIALIASAARAASSLSEANESVRNSLSSVPLLVDTLKRQLQEMTSVREAVSKATESGDSARTWFASELSKIEARFEGVQKRMLLMVDDARSESSRLRQQLRDTADGGITRENLFKGQLDEARREIARLNGVIEGLSKVR